MFYLLEDPKTSAAAKPERVFRQSKDGYDGWTEIATFANPPKDGEEYDPKSKKWKLDPAKEADRARFIEARDPDRLMKRLEATEARLDAIEALLDQTGSRK